MHEKEKKNEKIFNKMARNTRSFYFEIPRKDLCRYYETHKMGKIRFRLFVLVIFSS